MLLYPTGVRVGEAPAASNRGVLGSRDVANYAEENRMHAVVVRVNINDADGAMEELRRDVVPRVSQAPGFVAGYWTRKEDEGLSMTVWESEDAANQARERITQNMPQGVDLQESEVREVIANA
jgi:hypothetical protein